MKKKQKKVKINWKERLKKNTASYYKGFVFFIGSLFIIVILLGLFIRPKESEDETNLNQWYGNENLSYILMGKFLNSEEDKMILPIMLKGSNNIMDSKVDFFVQTKGDQSNKIQLEIYQGGENYYDLVVNELPKEWQALRLLIRIPDKQLTGTIILNREPEKDLYQSLNNTYPLSAEHAEIRSVFAEKRMIESEIQNRILVFQNESQNKILELQNKIPQIENDMEFKTEKQKLEDEKIISQIESEINVLSNKIKKSEEEKNEFENRIQLLDQKAEFLSNEFDISLNELLK